MSHIFVSYSRKDIDFAGKIVQALADNNLDTWIDWKSIPKGEDWEQEIYRGIEEADAFLFLISPDSVASEPCNKEISHAIKNGKRILPIFIANVEDRGIYGVTEKFPQEEHKKEISRLNFIKCREGRDNFDKSIEEIRTTIHTDYEWLKFHTELQVKALKWERQKDTSRLLRGKELREAEQQLTDISNQEDPQPTKLQREYVLFSRRNEEQQRRKMIIGLSLGLIIMVILSIFAWTQRNVAISQTNEKATALVNEEHARSTAVAEKVRADAQSELALARQLAAQAELLISQYPRQLDRAVLLSIESLNHSHTYEGDEALRRGLALLPKPVLKALIQPSSSSIALPDMGITAMDFSPDGKWLAIGTSSEIISIWDTSNWKEVARLEPGQYMEFRSVGSLAFSPDSRLLISGVANGLAQVWDVATRRELSSIFINGAISTVAFSPDGRSVASGVGERVIIWDPFTGKGIFSLSGGSDYIIFSPDNTKVAAAGCSEINVWDLKTGLVVNNKEQFPVSPGDTKCISALAFSPDSSLVASADGESGWTYPRPKQVGGTILVWEALTGKEISVMKHGDSVQAIVFSKNGEKLLSGSYDRTSRVWNIHTGQLINEFSYGPSMTTVKFGNDGDWVITAGNDGTARIWDSVTGAEINRLITGEDASLTMLAMHPTEPYIAAGNNFGEIWVWKVAGQESSEMDFGQYTAISSVSYNKDGKMLATASYDKTARTWDVASGKEIARATHEDRLLMAVFNPGGNLVASGSMDGVVKIWDSSTGKDAFMIPAFQTVGDIKFSPSGQYIAIAEGFFPRDGLYLFNALSEGHSAIVSVWDIKTKKEVIRLKHDNWVNSIDFSQDERLILTGSTDGISQIWEISSGKEISEVRSSHRINLVAYSPKGDFVASAESCFADPFGGKGCQPELKVWRPSNGEIVWQKSYPGVWIPSMAFSPDGKQLAIANTQSGSTSSMQVLEAGTGNLINEKIYDANFVLKMFSFNDDGTMLASGGGPSLEMGRVDIWDPTTGEDLARIPYWQPWSVSFSPDNRSIAIGGAQDGSAFAKIVPIHEEDLAKLACERLDHNLTKKEWIEYFGEQPYHETCGLRLNKIQPDGNSNSPVISANGQFILFTSEAANLVCNDTNLVQDIFRYDRENQSVELVSVSSGGMQSNNLSSSPKVSADGAYMVFESTATNLIANDDNNYRDIFLRAGGIKSTKAISVNSDGVLGNGDSISPSISGDGRYVVFASSATNLINGDTNNYCDTNYDEKKEENCQDIFLRDNQTNGTTLISVAANGMQANGRSELPVVSMDARYVVFYSEATNLDLSHQNAGWYIRDRQTGITKFLSANLEGPPEIQEGVSISQNAEYIAGIHVFDGKENPGEYYLEEIVLLTSKSNSEQTISALPNNDLGNHDSKSPDISPDGRYIVFSSESNNLVENDTNAAYDVYLWDGVVKQLKRATIAPDGTQSNGHSLSPTISSDGRYIVFTSMSTNLVSDDKNKFQDVFVYDIETGKTTRIEPPNNCK